MTGGEGPRPVGTALLIQGINSHDRFQNLAVVTLRDNFSYDSPLLKVHSASSFRPITDISLCSCASQYSHFHLPVLSSDTVNGDRFLFSFWSTETLWSWLVACTFTCLLSLAERYAGNRKTFCEFNSSHRRSLLSFSATLSVDRWFAWFITSQFVRTSR